MVGNVRSFWGYELLAFVLFKRVLFFFKNLKRRVNFLEQTEKKLVS
jgi:hypothetical protein